MDGTVETLKAQTFSCSRRFEGEANEGYVVWSPAGRPFTKPRSTEAAAWGAAIENLETGVNPATNIMNLPRGEPPPPPPVDNSPTIPEWLRQGD